MGLRSTLNISPASKASKRVMAQRSENSKRNSVVSNASYRTIGDIPATEASSSFLPPMERWTCANRIG